MAMTLSSLPMELQALVTLCDQNRKAEAGELFSGLKPQSFSDDEYQEAFLYLKQYAKEAGSGGFPSWADLLIDTKLSRGIRKRLRRESLNIESATEPTYLAKNLLSLAEVREMARITQRAVNELQQATESADPKAFTDKYKALFANVNESLVDISQSITSIGSGSERTRDLLEKILDKESMPYIPTGFSAFDSSSRGINLGALAIFAGKSGTGKSLLAGQMVRNMALAGFRVCMIGLEMTEVELMQRELARQMQTNLTKIVNTEDMTNPMRDEIRLGYDKLDKTLHEVNGCIDFFSPEEDMTIEQLLYAVKPQEYHAIFIDYVGLLGGLDGADQWKTMKNATRFGKMFAKRNNCVVSLLAQLTDEGSLRQSKAMKDDANNMWTWSLNDQERSEGILSIRQEKNRNGPMEPFRLKVDWATMTVTDEGHTGDLDRAVYKLGSGEGDRRNTWVTADVDFMRTEVPIYRIHDLHDADYWIDPVKGPCTAWVEMQKLGYIDSERIYGKSTYYNRNKDDNPVGNYIVPHNLRGDNYPADEDGRPLYDKHEKSYKTPEEREALGFKGLSKPEKDELLKTREFDDTPDEDFDEDEVEEEEVTATYTTNTEADTIAYDPEGVVRHPAACKHVTHNSYPYQNMDETDDEYRARVDHYYANPYIGTYYEPALGNYYRYQRLLAKGDYVDVPKHIFANLREFPAGVIEKMKRKLAPKTYGDLGVPTKLLTRFTYCIDSGKLSGTNITEVDPIRLPVRFSYNSKFENGFVTISSVEGLRHLFGVKWLEPSDMVSLERSGVTPEYINNADEEVVDESPVELPTVPLFEDDKEDELDDSTPIEHEPTPEEIEQEAKRRAAITPMFVPAPYDPDADDEEDEFDEDIAPAVESVFETLRKYREDKSSLPDLTNPKKRYADQWDSIPDNVKKGWNTLIKASTVRDIVVGAGDLGQFLDEPITRFIDKSTGKPLSYSTPLTMPMTLKDKDTGDVETVNKVVELLALFGLRFVY